jgi:hypothetical protein
MFPAFSRIWLINIVLAAFVVFFGIMSFNVWSKGDEAIQEMQTGKSAEKSPPGKRIMERAMPSESTYGIVADKNLFLSSRSESIPVELKQGALKISEKMIFLYGVVLMGGRNKALISNPESELEAGKSRAKEKWVVVGDTMGDFSVTEIRKDRIILTQGASKHEILLYDKNKPTRQTTVAEKPAAPVIVATGLAAAVAAPKPADTKPADTKPGAEPPVSRIGEGKKEKDATGEYEIINTPFGPLKRKVQ